jgi:ribosomal protein L3
MIEQSNLKNAQTSTEGVEQDVNVILETEFVDTGAWSRGGGFNGHTPKSD